MRMALNMLWTMILGVSKMSGNEQVKIMLQGFLGDVWKVLSSYIHAAEFHVVIRVNPIIEIHLAEILDVLQIAGFSVFQVVSPRLLILKKASVKVLEYPKNEETVVFA